MFLTFSVHTLAWFCCSQYDHVLYIFYSLAAFLKDRKPWIVKPVASSRGRGIYLVNHVSTDSQAVKCLSSMMIRSANKRNQTFLASSCARSFLILCSSARSSAVSSSSSLKHNTQSCINFWLFCTLTKTRQTYSTTKISVIEKV